MTPPLPPPNQPLEETEKVPRPQLTACGEHDDLNYKPYTRKTGREISSSTHDWPDIKTKAKAAKTDQLAIMTVRMCVIDGSIKTENIPISYITI